jgi:glycosyltransferase involved in cell wall biosynthesis
MKIVLINKFLYPKGGDAISTLNTGKLLTSKGHKVFFWGMHHLSNPPYPLQEYFVNYVDLNNLKGIRRKFQVAVNMFYSFEAKEKIQKFIEIEKPNIIHLHNFAHQISPSILDVFKKYKIPTIMTMHDYKLVCPVYTLYSNNKPCERCKDGRFYQCTINKCTKNSLAKSFLNTLEMYFHHKFLHIYDLVGIYISPSRFLKNKVEEMGLKGEVVYLPNFINLDEYTPQYNSEEKSIIYFGRLSQEKGLLTLVEAMKGLDIKLKIIGDGPLKETLEYKVKEEKIENIEFLGYLGGEQLKKNVRKAMFVVLPSEWYENNPLSIIEGFALGKPAIGARIGGIPELVKDNETGLTFEAGNAEDLRQKIEDLISDPNKVEQMGKIARKLVEQEFNREKHYESLIAIYQQAIRDG